MLTAQEIHIEINQGFQKIASNVYDYFLPEEIDWIFNKNQLRFISRCVRPRPDGSGAFEINEASEQDIQAIITKDVELIVNRIDNNKGFCYIPYNCDFIINDRSQVLTNCNSSFTNDTILYNIYSNTLEFPDSLLSTNCYNNLVIYKNGTPIFKSDDYKISNGLSTANQKFTLINLILNVLNSKGITVYWEQHNSLYIVNSFIFISSDDLDVFTLSMEEDITRTSIKYEDSNRRYATSTYEKEVPNRLTKGSSLYEVLSNNVLFKTNDKSPVTNLVENKLYVFNSERFIAPKIILDYIRKSREINLFLNRSSELSERAIIKVCDLSVEYMKNIVESPNYRLKQEDNIIRME